MTEHIDIAPNDLLWLAGLLDGDGCFRSYYNKKGKTPTPSVSLRMIDQDTVERVASFFGCNVSLTTSNKVNEKNTYQMAIHSQKALSLMRLLFPYLSGRRQEKIQGILKSSVSKIPALETFRCSNPPQTHTTSIYWLAGLLEAEGSFQKGAPSSPNTPTISIQMTDKDVIEQVASFFGVKMQSFQPKGRTKDGSRNFKKVYLCLIRGRPALNLMQKLQPLMSARRQQQIKDALDSYNPLAKEEADNKKRTIPDGELETIFQKRQQGLPLHQIATQYSVTRNVIRRCLERHTRLEQDQ